MSEYQKLREERGGKIRKRNLPVEIAKERQAENARRSAEARRRACAVLTVRHADEFAELLAGERKALDAEKGLLPGDVTGSKVQD